MADHARSDDPLVQDQFDRLARLSPGADILGLERITALLSRIGNPHLRLPPVFHVAGTNGKGSTCAVLRAALEGDGYQVHAYTSPHLVRFNERIRLAGALISDRKLAHYLSRVLDHAEGLSASFFECTTAAAFLSFAETPADACIIEVGLGGRLDATNVIPVPAACGIAQLGIDHEAFLGSDPAGIAREKAGIARPGRPLVTLSYSHDVRLAVADVAAAAGAKLMMESIDWYYADLGDTLRITIGDRTIVAQPPALPGRHQSANAALAVAMLASQSVVPVRIGALQIAPSVAKWPARLQTLRSGPLTAPLGERIAIVDGAHNASAAEALATYFRDKPPMTLILGMLINKDASGWLAAMRPYISRLIAVPVADHSCHPPEDLARIAANLGLAAAAAPTLADAISQAAECPEDVLIAGSLFLAGEALRINAQLPD